MNHVLKMTHVGHNSSPMAWDRSVAETLKHNSCKHLLAESIELDIWSSSSVAKKRFLNKNPQYAELGVIRSMHHCNIPDIMM